jgi:hypothetical protein
MLQILKLAIGGVLSLYTLVINANNVAYVFLFVQKMQFLLIKMEIEKILILITVKDVAYVLRSVLLML